MTRSEGQYGGNQQLDTEHRPFAGRFFTTIAAALSTQLFLDAGCRDEATEFLLAGEKTLQETEEKYQAAQFLRLRGRNSTVTRLQPRLRLEGSR